MQGDKFFLHVEVYKYLTTKDKQTAIRNLFFKLIQILVDFQFNTHFEQNYKQRLKYFPLLTDKNQCGGRILRTLIHNVTELSFSIVFPNGFSSGNLELSSLKACVSWVRSNFQE